MKEKIHPTYKESTIVCVCGEVIKTRSTKPSIHVDICSKCHPFFTGTQKLVDSAGRIEKFSKRYAGKVKPKVKAKTGEVKEVKEVKEAKKEEVSGEAKPE
ncbi:MAG: 50S ribosomal protein L31 [Candidatus Omnitrophica bacterium]|nr:50S ribosomal protein L31 [Candidatus Omnitrophota bacterium]